MHHGPRIDPQDANLTQAGNSIHSPLKRMPTPSERKNTNQRTAPKKTPKRYHEPHQTSKDGKDEPLT
ncbi:hypothetical protein BS50DRAFT_571823 [Corynespora cassiicola Philippines]|uniref:Uncharacterized protein n=1 Tax=Corynespora cassiicola Philippines TaxID=1448308 RepID=A0A2T2NT08_CORCC|nr:hypothetical protein BS50DRAFT_571823 [Corynespora cassiicola Philippines]